MILQKCYNRYKYIPGPRPDQSCGCMKECNNRYWDRQQRMAILFKLYKFPNTYRGRDLTRAAAACSNATTGTGTSNSDWLYSLDDTS